MRILLTCIPHDVITMHPTGIKTMNEEQKELLGKYEARLKSDIEFFESKIRQLESSIHYYETKIQDANIEISRLGITIEKISVGQTDFVTARDLMHNDNTS
jgi:hypothetical protein